jgi:hypothetical protein
MATRAQDADAYYSTVGMTSLPPFGNGDRVLHCHMLVFLQVCLGS